MDVELFNEKFRKNFFYGMDNKSDVIDYIILEKADSMVEADMSKIDTKLYRVEYTLQQIKKLLVQLYRFIYINEPTENQTYFYNKINENSEEVEELLQERISDLKKKYIIVGCIKNWEKSAIYITGGDGHNQYPGRAYYNNLSGSPTGIWIREEIIPILEQLCTLELENKEQYYALFLDTKYNRTINAQEQLRNEQIYLESKKNDISEQANLENIERRLQEIYIIQRALPMQIKEIQAVFSKFMNSIKISKQDVLEGLEVNLSGEVREYVDDKCSNYQTISTLKQDATDNFYKSRVNKIIEVLKNKQHSEEQII